MAGRGANIMAQQSQMEKQLIGKPFWHPDASRKEAEAFLKNANPGSFVIRRSSNPGYLALSHRLEDGNFGHALIMWDGSGYTLENANKSYSVIEQLIKSLNLRLEDVKKKRARPAVCFGFPVVFQVELLCTYNARSEHELSGERADIINVFGQEPGYWVGEMDGKAGKIPAGLTKRVPGSETPPPGAPPPPPQEALPNMQRVAQAVAQQQQQQQQQLAMNGPRPGQYGNISGAGPGGGIGMPGMMGGPGSRPAGYADPQQMGFGRGTMPLGGGNSSRGRQDSAVVSNLKQEQNGLVAQIGQIESRLTTEHLPQRRQEMQAEIQRLRGKLHDLDVAVQAVESDKRMSLVPGGMRGRGRGAGPGRGRGGGSPLAGGRGRGGIPAGRPSSGSQAARPETRGYNFEALTVNGTEYQFEELRSQLPKNAVGGGGGGGGGAASPAGPLPPGAEALYYAKAIADFEGVEQGELSFKRDDVIAILEQGSGDGWLKGCKNGVVGYIPESGCQRLP